GSLRAACLLVGSAMKGPAGSAGIGQEQGPTALARVRVTLSSPLNTPPSGLVLSGCLLHIAVKSLHCRVRKIKRPMLSVLSDPVGSFQGTAAKQAVTTIARGVVNGSSRLRRDQHLCFDREV